MEASSRAGQRPAWSVDGLQSVHELVDVRRTAFADDARMALDQEHRMTSRSLSAVEACEAAAKAFDGAPTRLYGAYINADGEAV
jgi:hypothetical protein